MFCRYCHRTEVYAGELLRNNIRIAYSNEAFELWYLLHFAYYNTVMSRNLYKEKLSEKLDDTYDKSNTIMYDILKQKQSVAIRNAAKLLSTYSPPNPVKDNPSTTVHLLVKLMNKFRK
ncbi:MAG: RloB domain-containing protein [Nitrospirae bacterium]|nr:RloB domain-containing protein [Nitrospirota bacterium]